MMQSNVLLLSLANDISRATVWGLRHLLSRAKAPIALTPAKEADRDIAKAIRELDVAFTLGRSEVQG